MERYLNRGPGVWVKGTFTPAEPQRGTSNANTANGADSADIRGVSSGPTTTSVDTKHTPVAPSSATGATIGAPTVGFPLPGTASNGGTTGSLAAGVTGQAKPEAGTLTAKQLGLVPGVGRLRKRTDIGASGAASEKRSATPGKQRKDSAAGLTQAQAHFKLWEKHYSRTSAEQAQLSTQAAAHSSNNQCPPTANGDAPAAQAATAPAAAAAMAGTAMRDDSVEREVYPPGVTQSSVRFDANDMDADGDPEATDEDDSGDDQDPNSDGEAEEWAKRIEAKVDTVGEGLAVLHGKVDRVIAVLFGALQAAGGGTYAAKTLKPQSTTSGQGR